MKAPARNGKATMLERSLGLGQVSLPSAIECTPGLWGAGIFKGCFTQQIGFDGVPEGAYS